MTLADDDKQLFREWVLDVNPLSPDDRVRLRKSLGDTARSPGRSPLTTPPEAAVFESSESVPPRRPEETLAFRRAGIQHGVFRKLRQGHYTPEGVLDLHGLTVAQARAEVRDFLCEADTLGVRVVLVIHGKGGRDRPGQATMKSHVAHWLEGEATVLAFHSAVPRDGGSGAVYVLLRKSREARQANRESHGGKAPYPER